MKCLLILSLAIIGFKICIKRYTFTASTCLSSLSYKRFIFSVFRLCAQNTQYNQNQLRKSAISDSRSYMLWNKNNNLDYDNVWKPLLFDFHDKLYGRRPNKVIYMTNAWRIRVNVFPGRQRICPSYWIPVDWDWFALCCMFFMLNVAGVYQ